MIKSAEHTQEELIRFFLMGAGLEDSYISPFIWQPLMRRSWVIWRATSQRRSDGIGEEAAWTRDPLEGGQKYELGLIWSRELCVSSVGPARGPGGGTATSEAIIWGWDHCLAPSLHAYGSERLSQPSSTTGCVISSLSPPRCARTFFFFFFLGEFCPFCLPAASVIIRLLFFFFLLNHN